MCTNELFGSKWRNDIFVLSIAFGLNGWISHLLKPDFMYKMVIDDSRGCLSILAPFPLEIQRYHRKAWLSLTNLDSWTLKDLYTATSNGWQRCVVWGANAKRITLLLLAILITSGEQWEEWPWTRRRMLQSNVGRACGMKILDIHFTKSSLSMKPVCCFPYRAPSGPPFV